MEKKVFETIIELENKKKSEIEGALKEAEEIRRRAEVEGKKIYEEIIEKKVEEGKEEARKIILEAERKSEIEYKRIMLEAEEKKKALRENVKNCEGEAIDIILKTLLERWKE